jgi:hypothetical protein
MGTTLMAMVVVQVWDFDYRRNALVDRPAQRARIA